MRESKEVRKQLSDDEAAPYMGSARVLLGELKNKMSYSNLSQLKMTKDYPNGVSITVSSIFGQDTIQINAPVDVKQSGIKKKISIDSFYPYLWIGVRNKTTIGDGSQINLFLWEDGKHDLLSNSIISERSTSGVQTSTYEWPLGDNYSSTDISGKQFYYNDNNIVAYSNYTDKDGVIWDHVIIANDETDIDMMGKVTKSVDGAYMAAFCVSGDDCSQNPPIDVEMKIIVGKYDKEISDKKTYTMTNFTSYNRAIYPYGHFIQYPYYGDCTTPIPDTGSNPHWLNWIDEVVDIYIPNKQIMVESSLLKKPSFGLVKKIPKGFEPGSFDKNSRCPIVDLVSWGGYSIGINNYDNEFSNGLATGTPWISQAAVLLAQAHAATQAEVDTMLQQGNQYPYSEGYLGCGENTYANYLLHFAGTPRILPSEVTFNDGGGHTFSAPVWGSFYIPINVPVAQDAQNNWYVINPNAYCTLHFDAELNTWATFPGIVPFSSFQVSGKCIVQGLNGFPCA
jgi:hypothetical protein